MDKEEIIRLVRERINETWPSRDMCGNTAPPEARDLLKILRRTEVTEWKSPDELDQYLEAIATAPPHDDATEITKRIRRALGAFWDRDIKADPLRSEPPDYLRSHLIPIIGEIEETRDARIAALEIERLNKMMGGNDVS